MRCTELTFLLLLAVAGLGLTSNGAGASEAKARAVLKTSKLRGGLLVHLGCRDGNLTAALRTSESWLVHGLDRDAANVEKARAHIRGLKLYGKVSVDVLKGKHLPYADNLVNLLVAEDLGGIPMGEVMRVLSPNGVFCRKQGGTWTRTVKPRPKELDEWTHLLHGPDNNAVSTDTAVGPPRHMQWVSSPRWTRSHEYTASVSSTVTAGGRVFYIADAGPTASVAAPAQWFLFARDAFSGVLLWKRPISVWNGHLGPALGGLADISRRLLAAGDRVYVSLGIGEPLAALDAASGKTIKVYEGTAGTREFVHDGKALYAIAGDVEDQKKIARRGYSTIKIVPRELVALDAETGRKIWGIVEKTVPCTLTVSGKRLFYQNPKEVVCLDKGSGKRLWASPRTSEAKQVKRNAVPTLVVSGGVLLTAEGSWRGSEIVALSAENGKELWKGKTKQAFNNVVDIFVIGEMVWTGMWSAYNPTFYAPRNLKTGSPGKLPGGKITFVGDKPRGHHHRCYRSKATSRFLLTARRGVEFIDMTTGKGYAYNGFRGTCQSGVVPANGLLYLPPNACGCYIQANMTGFKAMAPEWKPFPPEGNRLTKGPASGSIRNPQSAVRNGDWPTYRGSASRSGLARCDLPSGGNQLWVAEIGGRLSPPTVAGDRVYLASVEEHTVHALDAKKGKLLWSFTTGGRVDSPPTICGDAVLFGSADGHVYCLNAKDGKLAWRFRAAPADRRIVAWDGVESTWPVHGSVLVTRGENGTGPVVWAAAGRSSILSGGIRICRLKLTTGKLLSETRLDTTGTRPGGGANEKRTGGVEQSCLPDVLSSDGKNVFMRHVRFDMGGKRQVEGRKDPGVRHLYSNIGFLDDSWWQRTYWVFGAKMHLSHGLEGWDREALNNPFGRMLTLDGKTVYGFGRDNLGGGYSGGHVGLKNARRERESHYRLFSVDSTGPLKPLPAKGQRVKPHEQIRWKPGWAREVPLLARAMVLDKKTVFVAGPPAGDIKNLAGALAGMNGGVLLAASRADGKTVAELKLESPPVFDGMAAAYGRLYVSCTDGTLRCCGKK